MLAAALLLLLARSFSVVLVTRLLPIMAAEIAAIDDNIAIDALEIAHEPSGDVVRLRANLRRPAVVGNEMVYPLGWNGDDEGWYQVRVNVPSVLQGFIMYWVIVLAWPARGAVALSVRVGLALPLAVALMAVDTPLVLLGNFDRLASGAIAANGGSPLFAWARFLAGGGTLALAVGLAVITVALAQRDAHGPAKPSPPRQARQ